MHDIFSHYNAIVTAFIKILYSLAAPQLKYCRLIALPENCCSPKRVVSAVFSISVAGSTYEKVIMT